MSAGENLLASRIGSALRATGTLDGRLDRDATKALKLHLMKCLHAPVLRPSDELLLEAFESFATDGDLASLVQSVERCIHDIIAEDAPMGTQIVAHHRRVSLPRSSNSVFAIDSFVGLEAAHAAAAAAPENPAHAGAGMEPPSPSRITPVGDGRHSRVTGTLSRAALGGGMFSPAPALSPVPVTICYYAPEFEDVAQELASGPAGAAVVLHKIAWGVFEDGFPNIFIDQVKDCRYNPVMFLASFHSPEAVFQQLPVIYALPSYGAKRLTVVVPYYPTGTMERISTVGEVATAKSLARMISATPMAAHGPSQFAIFDIHALQEQFYFGDNIIVRLKSCIFLLIDRILALPDATNVVIAFPDEGAYKRFGGKLTVFGEAIVCAKRREGGGKRRVVISDGNPRGKHVIMVDDLVQTGNTLLECARVLRDAGAAAVSAYVTHAVFPNDSWRKFAAEPQPAGLARDAGTGSSNRSGDCSGGLTGADAAAAAAPTPAAAAITPPAPSSSSHVRLEKFWITNSHPLTARKLRGVAPFEVLSIAPVLEDLLGL